MQPKRYKKRCDNRSKHRWLSCKDFIRRSIGIPIERRDISRQPYRTDRNSNSTGSNRQTGSFCRNPIEREEKLTRTGRGRGGGDAAATPGLSRIIRIVYPVYILYIYLRIRKIRKDYEQERNMSRLVRVSDFVRHAQAQGLARRIFKAQQSCVPATALRA